eukprot:jgi/Bigna1/147578/aug1.213_g22286
MSAQPNEAKLGQGEGIQSSVNEEDDVPPAPPLTEDSDDTDENDDERRISVPPPPPEEEEENTLDHKLNDSGEHNIIDTSTKQPIDTMHTNSTVWMTPVGSRSQSPHEDSTVDVKLTNTNSESVPNIAVAPKGLSSEIRQESVDENKDEKFDEEENPKGVVRSIIMYAKIASYEEQEFQIGRDYGIIKDLQMKVAASAKQVALMEDDIESLKNLVNDFAQQKSK